MTVVVKFDAKIDTSQVDNMISKFGQRAVTEYRRALVETNSYGLIEIKNATPVRTGDAQKAWKWAFTGELISSIDNQVGYVAGLDSGWDRTNPIEPKNAKALVFQVGRKTAAKSSTTTLYKRYANAMKALKGKGLSPKEKQQQAVQKSGVVVVKNVKKPAKYSGKNFIQPVVNRIANKGTEQVLRATDRLVA